MKIDKDMILIKLVAKVAYCPHNIYLEHSNLFPYLKMETSWELKGTFLKLQMGFSIQNRIAEKAINPFISSNLIKEK